MKKRTKVKELKSSSSPILKYILQGSLIALCTSLILILVFAFILKFTNISDSIILPVNQVIKGISVFIGVFLGLKKSKELGLVCGLLIGFIYSIIAFLVFSILSGGFSFNISVLTDIVFGAIIGAICGIICVNIKKSTN